MLPSTRPHNHPGEHKCSSSRSHELSAFPLLPCAPTNCTLSPGMLRNFLLLLCLLNCKEARRKVHSRVRAVQSLVKKNKSLPGLATPAIRSGTVGMWTRTANSDGFFVAAAGDKRQEGAWLPEQQPAPACCSLPFAWETNTEHCGVLVPSYKYNLHSTPSALFCCFSFKASAVSCWCQMD